jgi:hypothetical protein
MFYIKVIVFDQEIHGYSWQVFVDAKRIPGIVVCCDELPYMCRVQTAVLQAAAEHFQQVS